MELQNKRSRTFEHLLQMCFRHVLKSADLERTSCAFEVPEVILGLPVFDISQAILYIQQNLLKRDFKVAYIFPRVLLINWDNPASSPGLQPQWMKHARRQHATVSAPPPPPQLPHQEWHTPPKPPPPPLDRRQQTSLGPPAPVCTSKNRDPSPCSPVPSPQCRLSPLCSIQKEQKIRAAPPPRPELAAAAELVAFAAAPVVRPIADLKPSGKFVLNLC